MKQKRFFALGLAALLSATAMAGCSSGEAGGGAVDVNEDGTVNNPEAVDVDPDKLVFWSLFSGGDGEFMDQIIDDYNGTDPDKEIESVMLVWDDYYTKLTTAVATGNGPDIGVSHISKLPELVAKGVVDPIDDYASGVDWSQYPDASSDGVTFDGSHYAVPLDTHAQIMYVNTDFFDAAGIELGDGGQLAVSDAADFASIMDRLKGTMSGDDTVLALPQTGDDPYRAWWATYFQMGGTPIVSSDGSSITMDAGIAVDAADYIKSLYDDGYIQPGITDHQKMFQDGHAAIMFGGTWATGAFEQTDDLHFAPGLFPSLFNGSQATWADSHVLVIPANDDRSADETQAAVDFIGWASSEGGLTWAGSGQIPANSSVSGSPEFEALENRSLYVQAKEVAVLPPQNEDFYALKATIITNLDTIWNDQADSASAIDNMITEMESDLS